MNDLDAKQALYAHELQDEVNCSKKENDELTDVFPCDLEHLNEEASKIFYLPKKQREFIDDNSYFKDRNAKLEVVPIDTLIDDNDLDNKDTLSNHQALWGSNPEEYKYDSSKDSSAWEIPNATRLKNGKLSINDGRHRIRALKNDGYTHIELPVIVDESMNESVVLDEAKRSQLLTKSRNADNYKDMSKGKNRFERRLLSRISTRVAQYNRIDFDSFFKRDILTIGVEVKGETDDYIVTMKFAGVLDEIQRAVKANNNQLSLKLIVQSLVRTFNNDDVFIDCNCPDSRYRQRYWQSKNGYNAGPRELRPSDVTNPNDTKGAGCKHVLLVLSNLNWLIKTASVINNYIKYCQQNMQRNYAEYIFPKIYGMPYNKAVQISLFDKGMFDNGYLAKDNIDTANRQGRVSGRFKPSNSPKKIVPKEIKGQQKLF